MRLGDAGEFDVVFPRLFLEVFQLILFFACFYLAQQGNGVVGSNQNEGFAYLAGSQSAMNSAVANRMWNEIRLQGWDFFLFVGVSEIEFHESDLF